MKLCQSAAACSNQPQAHVTHTGRVLLDLLGITDQDITGLTLQCKAGELPMLTLERALLKSFVTPDRKHFRLVAEDIPTPATPSLDLDAMQAQAQQRVQEWTRRKAKELSSDYYAQMMMSIANRVVSDLAYMEARKMGSAIHNMLMGHDGGPGFGFGFGFHTGGLVGAAA